jgi:predicted lipoprotein with Yx(FWY)xxD motif
MAFRPAYRVLAPLAALAAALTLTATAQAAAPAGTARGTEITVASTAFGRALAVGSGPFKNRSLYFISSDNPPGYGCTTGVTKTLFGSFPCTGPATDTKAEWPAITTVGRPVAGPGVNAALLGTVQRKGVGDQVTYDGHPLYLFTFDTGSDTELFGEGFNEPGVPPWHGVWWLISPAGYPVPWAGTLTTTPIGSTTVLAASYMTQLGWVNFPLYTFSADKPGRAVCSRTAACARAWPPVITGSRAGAIGVPTSRIGAITITGHLGQVTWNGHPLYLFASEKLTLLANGRAAPEGNGNGIRAFGGTFRLVVSP